MTFENSLTFRKKGKERNSLTSSKNKFTDKTILMFISKGKCIKLIFTSKYYI